MGKIVDFGETEKNTQSKKNQAMLAKNGYRTENDAVLARQAEELINEFETFNSVMRGRVEATLAMIAAIPEREGIVFNLANPFETGALDQDDTCYNITAFGTCGEDAYLIYADLAEQEDITKGISYEIGAKKIDSEGNFYTLDDNDEWVLIESAEKNSMEPWALKVFEKGGAKAELMDLMFCKNDSASEDEWCSFCSGHSLLIKLENMSDGLLMLDMTSSGEVILTSTDADHMGFAIRQDGNSLVLCQWLESFTVKDFLEGGSEWLTDQYEEDEDACFECLPEEYLYDIERITINEAKSFCEQFVDRYSHEGLFTFPLSKTKSLRARESIIENPDRINQLAKKLGDLSKDERSALDSLKKTIGCTR